MSRTTGSTGTPADNAVVESMFDKTNPRSERPTRTMPARNQNHGRVGGYLGVKVAFGYWCRRQADHM